MPKVENLTLRITRDSLRTPTSGSNSATKCKPTLFLPIESKRSLSYVPAPVGRTISTESTDTSLSPSADRLLGKLSPIEASVKRFSQAHLSAHSEARILGSSQKSVSWAPVSEVRVIGIPDPSSDGESVIQDCVESFVKKLRRSPKHADTIYVYQRAPSMDFDDQQAYQPCSSEPLFVDCDTNAPILCESSN